MVPVFYWSSSYWTFICNLAALYKLFLYSHQHSQARYHFTFTQHLLFFHALFSLLYVMIWGCYINISYQNHQHKWLTILWNHHLLCIDLEQGWPPLTRIYSHQYSVDFMTFNPNLDELTISFRGCVWKWSFSSHYGGAAGVWHPAHPPHVPVLQCKGRLQWPGLCQVDCGCKGSWYDRVHLFALTWWIFFLCQIHPPWVMKHLHYIHVGVKKYEEGVR